MLHVRIFAWWEPQLETNGVSAHLCARACAILMVDLAKTHKIVNGVAERKIFAADHHACSLAIFMDIVLLWLSTCPSPSAIVRCRHKINIPRCLISNSRCCALPWNQQGSKADSVNISHIKQTSSKTISGPGLHFYVSRTKILDSHGKE